MEINRNIQETIEIGTKTLETLSEQDNTIKNIDNNLNSINNNLNISEIIISKMESLGFRIKTYLFGESKKQKCKIKDNTNINRHIMDFCSNDVSSNLKIIKNINNVIGEQLDTQNENLDIINTNIEYKANTIKNLNLKINKI